MREVLIIDIFKTSEEDILKAPIDLIVLHFANEYANVTYTIPINSPITANSGFSSG